MSKPLSGWEMVLAIIEGLQATGHTGDVSVRLRLQDGGIRRARVVNEQEVTLAELVTVQAA